MKKKVLVIHGNGGASSRFAPFLEIVQQTDTNYEVVLPALPGFEGRSLPRVNDYWSLFIESLEQAVVEAGADGEWILYGHGVGGSMLLEWAARNWVLAGQTGWQPKAVILHSCIGASLQVRWFPRLMKPKWVRLLIQRMVHTSLLQPLWERRLFLHPETIPVQQRRQFFQDYARCAAFPILFDLITVPWYRKVQQRVGHRPFHFLWGDQERVVASHHLTLWKNDFPKSSFEVVPDWDHFPMLEQPEAFFRVLTNRIAQTDKIGWHK